MAMAFLMWREISYYGTTVLDVARRPRELSCQSIVKFSWIKDFQSFKNCIGISGVAIQSNDRSGERKGPVKRKRPGEYLKSFFRSFFYI